MTKEEVLIEALPYIQTYEGKTFVVKFGGAVMVEENLKRAFAKDATMLKKLGINIVVAHGGGKEITKIADAFGIETRFVNGLRYTDEKTLEAVLMGLCSLNKEIAGLITKNGGNAIGLCGADAALLKAKKLVSEIDLGFVGEVVGVNVALLELLMKNEMIPVVAPIGMGERGELYNINADAVASAIAIALKAEKLVYLSDIEGVMVDGKRMPSLNRAQATTLIQEGKICGGMIPKVNSAFEAIEAGVKKVRFIDGRIKHSLLLEVFTSDGVGTEITSDNETARLAAFADDVDGKNEP
ncbi:MAG: acetylglutamate kinase [Chloroherpetonaceae bacterium]|nr:acetylglutamate kinase [Chloroherpetonaceae bacterium]MDW8438588.1 acetylglutamate kinase [Chloroherpetonaceae bacterium]